MMLKLPRATRSASFSAALALLAMLATNRTAESGDILRGGASVGSPSSVAASGGPVSSTAQATAIAQRAQDSLARATQTLQAVKAMQSAARAAAISGPNNLINPANAALNVPNGLSVAGAGGLVPDSGLASTGVANPVTTWSNALTPVQTEGANGTTVVTVKQTAQQALANWNTFNVGKETTLKFDQTGGGANVNQWIIFNKINDPSGRPSQILGAIEAPGQAYVLNQNGIMFGGSSQLNLHTLVASSLPINDNLISRGLLNNPDAQFLFSSLQIPAGSKGTPAFTPPAPVKDDEGNDIRGDVTVEKGATISSPTTPEHVGGRVALLGPNVTNKGTISTPDGQTILAAGDQVGMAAHSANDPSLRGLDVYVGSVGANSGIATNSGLIDAPRAAVTIAGEHVNQFGFIDSSTSVSLNGRIDLLANYNSVSSRGVSGLPPFLPSSAGTVTFGAGSVSQILPEWSSKDRVVGIQLALNSQVNVQGKALYLATGASLLAPSGNVTLNAGTWVYGTQGGAPVDTFVYSAGQIYLDSDAEINVAGSTDISAPVSENIVSVQLRASELADSPLQRDGPLRGQTIQVDIRQQGIYNNQPWVGTPLANVSGYVGLIQRTVGELTTAGGTVALNAGDSVVMQPGASVDVSGGWINYEGGPVQTTRVVSNGQIYDISKATPNLVYEGIYDGNSTVNYPKWGVSQTFTNPLPSNVRYESGYLYGFNAGSISITAPSVALDGELFGNSVSGPRQRTLGPQPGSLSLVFQAQYQPSQTNPSSFITYSPTPPKIVFDSGSLQAADPFAVDTDGNPAPLRTDRKATVLLSPDLVNRNGFSILSINDSYDNIGTITSTNGGTVTQLDGTSTPFAANTAITVAAASSVSIPSDSIITSTSGGTIHRPDGTSVSLAANVPTNVTANSSITLTGHDDHFSNIVLPAAFDLIADPITYLDGTGTQQHSLLQLAAGNIDLEGRILFPGGNLSFTVYDISPNSFATWSATPLRADPARGQFTLGATASLNTAGLLVDDRPSSPTALRTPLVTAGGKVTIRSYSAEFGEGSKIDVSGGIAVSSTAKVTFGSGGKIAIQAGQDLQIPSLLGGRLALDTDLMGYAGKNGASLSILAPLIQIGGTTAPADTLSLAPDFFSMGGFASYNLTGLGAVTGQPSQLLPAIQIAPDTVISPVVKNWVADLDAGGILLTAESLPESVRTPVSLILNAAGVRDSTPQASNPVPVRGDLRMGAGAVIQTDPKGSVSLNGDTVVELGSILAPGGTISIAGASGVLQGLGTTSVDIGPHSFLSTAGTVVSTPDPRGYHTGVVLPGGNITISGGIVAETGAVLDVSGASGVLDLAPTYSNVNISPNSAAGAFLIPTRVDSNGGSIMLKGGQELFTDATLIGAAGGPAATGGSLTVSSGIFGGTGSPLEVNLLVTQHGPTIPASYMETGESVIDNPVTDSNGNALPGRGYFAADSFNLGGFSSLTLKGSVQFSGPVTITAPGSLSIADGGVIFADSGSNLQAPYQVSLLAPYVKLGTAFQTPLLPQQLVSQPSAFIVGNNPFYFQPAYGPSSLTVSANLIDIGNLSLQNIGTLNLIATNGDVRGDGTLDVAGDVLISAGQIYPPTAVSFTIAAYDHGASQGSVRTSLSGQRQPPLSAGGTLNVYASNIDQGGVLRAPMGTINLGWDGTGSGPTTDLISGAGIKDVSGNFITKLPVTRQMNLAAGSVTATSAIDPFTGKALVIPYGLNQNGTSWIDPSGNDITRTGIPQKLINISAQNVAEQAGATIDIRGAGDLYAYRFVSGLGGSADVLSPYLSSGFAIIPGYQADYAPYAPFNTSSGSFTSSSGSSDPGYVGNSSISLQVGDRIYLDASSGVPTGTYTLLPARYALLPDAFLVTPKSGPPTPPSLQPDGSSIVSGYRFNAFDMTRTAPPLNAQYEVAASRVVRQRAQYDDSLANNFFPKTTNLPKDSGRLVLESTQRLALLGSVLAPALNGGRGGLVDISSPLDILIAAPGTPTTTGQLFLDSNELSNFGTESLLIGGTRQPGSTGTSISVNTGKVTVDNEGAPLTGQDVILVATNALQIDDGAEVSSASSPGAGTDPLLVSGDGVLLRISGDPSASISRSNVTASTLPAFTLGKGVQLTGSSVILDSSSVTTIDPTAKVSGKSITIDSGRINFVLNNDQPGSGLVLAGPVLEGLQGAQALSFLSYSSIDIYGDGQLGSAALSRLTLSAGNVRGFNNGGGTVTFAAEDIALNNAAGAAPSAIEVTPPPQGTMLVFDATKTIGLGANQLRVDQFAGLELKALSEIFVQGTGGLATQGTITLKTPLITGAAAANQSISAAGDLTIQIPQSASAPATTGGLGASLALTGASVTVNGNIALPSGVLSLEAKSGNLTIGDLTSSLIDVSGVARSFFDVIKQTSGGRINLVADTGNVNLAPGSNINVSAPPGGASAGSLTVSAPAGSFSLAGAVSGQAGNFSLDTGSLPLKNLSSLNASLAAGGFTQSISIRDRNDDQVTVDGVATAHIFNLSADTGSILVTGTIDAHGVTGGTINLQARGSLILQAGSKLDAVGDYYDNAGKGGAVTLEAGSETNGNFVVSTQNADGTFGGSGFLDIQKGSEIDLGVNHPLTTMDLVLGLTTDNRTDLSTGTLHLRAPQTAANTDLQLNPISGSINGASSIFVEGYKIYDTTASGGSIDAQETNVLNNGILFAGNTSGVISRLLPATGPNASLTSVTHFLPGAEIINTSGNLTLARNWDLSNYRFGPDADPQVRGSGEPGYLALRAKGNLIFSYDTKNKVAASLSDGFDPTTSSTSNVLWDALLLAPGTKSWSYRLVSGADFGAADFRITNQNGSTLIGLGTPALPLSSTGRLTAIPPYFQTIRTGTGNIEIYSGGDVQLLNPLATIYTAGSQAPGIANFDAPVLFNGSALAPVYIAQYSAGGGNVVIHAKNDIAHYLSSNGKLVADSTKELPTSWLYRRGILDATGTAFAPTRNGDIASTSWWNDFSNFFEGVGALGGGNVSLIADHDISNVDAVVPTNARMPKGTPDAGSLVELGGGDLTIHAGRDINGGTYYVERGQGTLTAGNTIKTNSTRAAVAQGATFAPPTSWLPTTLFVGKGSFDLAATGDILFGPAPNAFLLPPALNNGFFNKTFFTTYAPSDSITATSMTGSISIKNSTTGDGTLQNWYANVLFQGNTNSYAARSQPWLRLADSAVNLFSQLTDLMPPALQVTAFSGDINLAGRITLSPSAVGDINLLAAGSLNGFQPTSTDFSTSNKIWTSSLINLSDADPSQLPDIASPLASTTTRTTANLFDDINRLFNESGSTIGNFGVLQTKQALHAPGVLHINDSEPVRLYSLDGNISGTTLFSGKFARVIAGQDLTDVALYLQNDRPDDISVVSAGRDIVLFDTLSPLRTQAQTAGNQLGVIPSVATYDLASGSPTAGDIQISGPGTLEVFAGRNLDLGTGGNDSLGNGVGITSIGNARNPYLPFAGADVVAAAGIGLAEGLADSNTGLGFSQFISDFLDPSTAGAQAERYLPELGALLGLSNADNSQIWDEFSQLSPEHKEEQNLLALDIFYLVLRDTGRDHNDAESPNFATYTNGFDAIKALFPGDKWGGGITTNARDLRTKSGGNISLFAPGGQLALQTSTVGNSQSPPGIITEDGGNISIFTDQSVDIGIARIFTLRGGNIVIWSSEGNIAAGSSAKTVQSAPPTRVLVDPQSADLSTDLAGLATGGGIGVLATVTGVEPGDVDLIAPAGSIDAGDAGIRSVGNLNLAAVQILNAGNIQVSGSSGGVPSTAVAAPNIGGLTAASNTTAAAGNSAAADQTSAQRRLQEAQEELPSIITVEVIGYGGGDPESASNDRPSETPLFVSGW